MKPNAPASGNMDPQALDPQALDPQTLASARALPAQAYVDPRLALVEQDDIFGRSWHLLAHASRLGASGDHVVADCGGLPLITLRGSDDTIRAFHNVCRHRAGPLAYCDGLAAKSLRCRYHGWTYGLDGALKSAPEMETAVDFDKRSIRLPQLEVRIWQGLVFATPDVDTAPDFDSFIDGIDPRLGADRGLAGYGNHRHVAYDIACNWKVYVDNFLEGYHLPHVHPALNRLLDYRSYEIELSDWHALQWSPLRMPEEGVDNTAYGNGDALYYWLWPNTMLNILPGRLQTNRVVPLGVDRCRVEFDFYYATDPATGQPDQSRLDSDLAFSEEVQAEDIAICEAVQRGLASGSYEAGRLNPLREQAVHHFHELLRRAYRGVDASSPT